MNGYSKLYQEFYKKVAATPRPAAANTASSVPVAKATTARAPQAAPTAQGRPDIQTLPNTNIQYRQYDANDPYVRKLKGRLRRTGFARFNENGPWIATPHGTNIMRELPKGLDRGVIQAMLAEGKVPLGVFDAATLAAQTAKAHAQATPPVNTPYQPSQSVNVPQQTTQASQPIVRPTTRTSKRRPLSITEALRLREERINKAIYRKYPFLAEIDAYNKQSKALKRNRERDAAEYYRVYYGNLAKERALANDIINKHVPYNTNYKMTPEQQARWDFYKKNPDMFPFGDINNYYNKPTALNVSSLPPKSINQRFDDFYNYNLVPAYGDMRNSLRNLFYTLNTPFREMQAIASRR